jgi:putative oxidoreductase
MVRRMMTRRWMQTVWDKGWAVLILRLLVGFGFAAHGYAKLERGPQHFAAALLGMHVMAPLFMAWLVTLIELLGGALLMAGAFVRPLCWPFSIIMVTAMIGVHLPYGFSSVKLRAVTAQGAEFGPTGYEVNLFYLAALLILAVAPSGIFSIDGWLDKRRREHHASG